MDAVEFSHTGQCLRLSQQDTRSATLTKMAERRGRECVGWIGGGGHRKEEIMARRLLLNELAEPKRADDSHNKMLPVQESAQAGRDWVRGHQQDLIVQSLAQCLQS